MIEYTVKVCNDRTEWWLNGQLHRVDGPAIEYISGGKEWYLNGKHHRKDGPAIEYADGYKAWYLNGKRHREDGPAIERKKGINVWFLNGQEYTEEEFNRKMNPIKELTVAEISNLLGFEVKVVQG